MPWKLHSFNTRHASYADPEKLGLSLEQGPDGLPAEVPRELAWKLDTGRAFWLSYFEHGNCLWFLRDGPVPTGVEFRWDGRRLAGLLVWTGKAEPRDPRRSARRYLKKYTEWVNGESSAAP